MKEKYRVLSRDAIKYIAAAAMLCNHISTVFMKPGTFPAEVFLDIGYFTAITMCFFLVEGFYQTRSRKKYLIRLAVFAGISEIPFCFAFSEKGCLEFRGMNMIFTLFLCFLILVTEENVNNKFLRHTAVAGLVTLSCFSDWAVLAPVFTLLFFRARGSRSRLVKAFIFAAVLFGLLNFAGGTDRFTLALSLLYALGSMLGIVLSGVTIIFLYNGKRARLGRTFSKWFFYWFYPIHLLVLGVLRHCSV